MQKMQRVIFLSIVSLVFSSTGLSQTPCPPPPTSIDPSVSAKVSYDRIARIYTYRYVIRNGEESLLPINWFTFLMNQQPANIQAPAYWLQRYIDSPNIPTNLRWATILADPSGSAQTENFDLPVPAHAIQPGRQLQGFSFQSSRPPGVLQFYAEGFTQIPSATSTPSDDEPLPNCPGWDFDSPHLQTLVTDMTTGPSSPNVISVAIRLREENGEHRNAINPNDPTGQIAVLVLSSDTFDASQIDVSSIRFGPGQSAPISSQLVPAGSEDQSRNEEREEWETIRDSFGDHEGNNRKLEGLLLVFDLKSLAVQCVLDKALFLTGITKSGVGIIGGVSSRTVGCDVRAPGTRKKRENHETN
jgi:hypothetical protein